MNALHFGHACVLGLLLAAPAQNTHVQTDLTKDKTNYEHAADPIARAKAIEKLGHEEYVAARQALETGKMEEALQFLKDYNHQVTETHDALVKTGLDPVKHSNGFRQLQISVRERERDLRELIDHIGFAQREPFDKLGDTLDSLNQKLILELFPRRAPNKQSGQQDNP